MNQSERRQYLIKTLLDENTSYKGIDIPGEAEEQKKVA